MKKNFPKYLIFLLLTVFGANTFAVQNINNDFESNYKKARNLIDSINFYLGKDEVKYNLYADQFNRLDFESLLDSNFRKVILDRTDFLRRNYRYEEAIPIISNSLLIAKKKKDTISMATFYKMLSTLYYYLDNYDSTYAQLDKAYALYNSLNNIAELGIIDIRKARIEYDLGNYEKAIQFSFKALELSKTAGDKQKVAISYLQL